MNFTHSLVFGRTKCTLPSNQVYKCKMFLIIFKDFKCTSQLFNKRPMGHMTRYLSINISPLTWNMFYLNWSSSSAYETDFLKISFKKVWILLLLEKATPFIWEYMWNPSKLLVPNLVETEITCGWGLYGTRFHAINLIENYPLFKCRDQVW